jgi:hypothetical protein
MQLRQGGRRRRLANLQLCPVAAFGSRHLQLAANPCHVAGGNAKACRDFEHRFHPDQRVQLLPAEGGRRFFRQLHMGAYSFISRRRDHMSAIMIGAFNCTDSFLLQTGHCGAAVERRKSTLSGPPRIRLEFPLSSAGSRSRSGQGVTGDHRESTICHVDMLST